MGLFLFCLFSSIFITFGNKGTGVASKSQIPWCSLGLLIYMSREKGGITSNFSLRDALKSKPFGVQWSKGRSLVDEGLSRVDLANPELHFSELPFLQSSW